jgi:hypothetical protein
MLGVQVFLDEDVLDLHAHGRYGLHQGITKDLLTVYFSSHILGKTMQYTEVELAHTPP